MVTAVSLPSSLIAANTAFGILIVAPMIAGQALLDLLLAATRWKQKMRHEVIARSVVEPYVAIAVAVAAAAAGFESSGLLISYWAGTLIALAYAVGGVRSIYGGLDLRRYRPSAGRLRAMLRLTAMPTLTDLAGALFARIDLYLVGMLMGEAPAGIYGMARQMRTPPRQVRQSFDGMLTPLIARTLAASGPAETGAATASAARLILAIQLFTLVGLVAIGRPVLTWLGPEFAAGYWAMVILVAAETILGAFGVGDAILLYRRPALGVLITAASIAVTLLLAWPMIDRFGLNGAAASVLIAVSAGALLRRHLLRASFSVNVPIAYNSGPIVAGIAGLGTALSLEKLLADYSTWPATAAVLLVSLAIYAATLKAWLRARGEALELIKFTTRSGQLVKPQEQVMIER
jgi:O-antigen/teichoic acid export membrane protein